MVQALVLVGGFGTRLRPLTLTRPKQMLHVGGRPMIERVAIGLAAHGVTEAILSMGYRPDAFSEAYPDGVCHGVELRFVVEPEPLGTAGAIAYAVDQAGIDDTFLVLNGDIISDMDLGRLMAVHRASDAEATIALTPVDDPSRFGVVVADAEGRVERFVEKPPAGTAPSQLINAGAYALEPALCARIPRGRSVSIERETFPAVVEAGALRAHTDDAYWLDCGTPAALLRANLDLLDGTRADPLATPVVAGTVDPGATVDSSWIGVDAVVEAGARVVGSVVFPGSRIEAGATVVGSVLGADVVVGAGAEVAELSVVGDGVTIEPEATLIGQRRPDPDV